MDIIKGDIYNIALTGKYDIVLQGCNCQNTQGSGIGKRIKETCPEAYAADCATKCGDRGKLGTYSKATIVRGDVSFVVCNLYTQYRYGPPHEMHFDYGAFEQSLRLLCGDLTRPGVRILTPLIGTGLAGGRWRRIRRILETELVEHRVTLVKF